MKWMTLVEKVQLLKLKATCWRSAIWATIAYGANPAAIEQTAERHRIPRFLSASLWYLKKLGGVGTMYDFIYSLRSAPPSQPDLIEGGTSIFNVVHRLRTDLSGLWEMSTHKKLWDDAFDTDFKDTSRLFVIFDLLYLRPRFYCAFLKTMCMLGNIQKCQYEEWVALCATLDDESERTYVATTSAPPFEKFLDSQWELFLLGKLTPEEFRKHCVALTETTEQGF